MTPNKEADRQFYAKYAAVEEALKPYIDGAYTSAGDAQCCVCMDDARIVESVGVVEECFYCKRDLNSACEHGGQSEFVRVPYAACTLFKLPESLSTGAEDDKALPLAEAEKGYALMRDRSAGTIKVSLQA